VLKPPVARAREHLVRSTHGTRRDPYFWLRDDTRSDPEVLAYLNAENAYYESVMRPHLAVIEELYQEIVARIREDDTSVPVRYRGYWYWTEQRRGSEYAWHWRRADREESKPELLLDCNERAAGHSFYQLGGYEISPDNRLLACIEDFVGRRQFQLRFKDLDTGAFFEDVVENVAGSVVWTDDCRSVLYVEQDPVTLLGRRVRRHVLGTDPTTDMLIYEEEDESFDLAVSRSKSERFLFLIAESTVSSEWRYARVDDPHLHFEIFLPRARDHEYDIEHLDDAFIVRTNWQAPNFRIMRAEIAPHTTCAQWTQIVAHDPEIFIHEVEVFRTFLALSERSGGLRRIRVCPMNGEAFVIAATDPTYTADIGQNPDLDTTVLRYVYTSLTTPVTTYEYDIVTGQQTLLKREAVLGDFDPARYRSEFLWAEATDGARIPISLVYRPDRAHLGTAPLYLYAYGAYGVTIDPIFSSARLSLLDRGYVFAIAHVRGGQELGRQWYDGGRLLNKRNTFTDYIDATRFLVKHGYAAQGRVIAAGGSAGGLLVGAVINMAPQEYCAAVAHVPFVDSVTTMLDETIPLTTLEYDEWGDPNQRKFYEYMLTYSPYDNVRRQAYPALLVTSGLWDSQVQYFEPVKWVAKLRSMNTGIQPILLKIEMQAGHGGKSGRYQHLQETAQEYAFVLLATEQRLLAPASEEESLATGTETR
jgi:oligopeptidase B